MGDSVDTYKPLARGEAFGEQFITITHNFLLCLLRPTAWIFRLFCQKLLLDWLSSSLPARRLPISNSPNSLSSLSSPSSLNIGILRPGRERRVKTRLPFHLMNLILTLS